ncbi:MAG: polysaccharide deacetylase family protein [Oscillospiraceae bacterium]|nr:polysaccharide deacetylase family protein [Oscillospiraceae bacterium]
MKRLPKKKTVPRLPLAVFLIVGIIIISLAGCAAYRLTNSMGNTSGETGAVPAVSDAPESDMIVATAEMDALNSKIEYGDPTKLISNSGILLAYISYPQSMGFADERIENWVTDTYADGQAQLDELLKTDSGAHGEINIQFDSYFVDNRYAGILEKGMLSLSSMAHPGDIIKTFNIDTEKKIFLENTDILDFSKLDTILPLLRAQLLSEYPDESDRLDDISEEWLTHLLIGHDGIIVLLERSQYLPTYLGTQTITLPYDKLDQALKLGKDSQPDSSAEPQEPDASPEPDEPESTNYPETDAPPQNGNIDPSKPMVALTFDDGPSKYTAHVLDLLEQYNCRATFFVVGNIVSNRSEVVARAYDMGCEIGGHSWSHRNLSKLSEDDIRQELNDTSNAIEAATGVQPKFFRPPYGAVNKSVKSVSADLGQAIINWSVDTLDWKTKNSGAVYNAIMKDTTNKAIILLHDLHKTTAEAMDRVIPALLEKGYQLVTVSELMEYSDKTMQAGVVYNSGK